MLVLSQNSTYNITKTIASKGAKMHILSYIYNVVYVDITVVEYKLYIFLIIVRDLVLKVLYIRRVP